MNEKSTWKEPLIHQDTTSCQPFSEPERKDFVTRHQFINQTGIYVTPIYFYTVYEDFLRSGVTPEEFMRDYAEKYAPFPIEEIKLDGKFKYSMVDFDISGADRNPEDVYPNIWEILDTLAVEFYELRILKECDEKIIADLKEHLLKMRPSNGAVG